MSFPAKKFISSLFLTITLSSAFFFLPKRAEAEQTPPQAQMADTVDFGCAWSFSGTILLDCVLELEYAIIVGGSRKIFDLASNIFDTLWAFGLSSESYKQDDFIGAGWIVCRDIANTFFIFILLYIAITTILQIGGGSKSLLSTLIIVALLMNFSLYITRFVVDIGNMFAIEFYSAFPPNNDPVVKNIPGIEQHSISSGFQNALVVPLFEIGRNVKNENGGFGVKAIMILFVGLEFLVVSFVWLISSFLLIGRIATLWILMILSPLAIFSLALPPAASGANIWGRWKGELVKATFFPAIFLFFMYFAVRLAQSTSYITQTFGTAATNETSLVLRMIPLFIQFAIIIAFIMFGLKTATGMSGAAGKMAAAYGGAAVLGGAAMAGRQVGGRVANWARKDREAGGLGLGQKLSTSRIGRFALSGINQAAEGTWDARATSIGGKVIGASGVSLGQVGGQGGFAKQAQETKRKYKAVYDSLKGNPEAQAKMVANLRKLGEGMVNINGAEQRMRINPDRDVKDLMSSLSVRERMDLIEKAQGPDKEYLSQINKGLSEEALPEKRKEEIKSEYDFLKDKPKAQAAFIANLHISGQQDQIAPLMKKLSAKERYNAIMESGGDTRAFLEDVNKKVMEEFKPDQKIKDEKEWKETETLGSFKESLKGYRNSKEDAKKAEVAGDANLIEKHKKEMGEHKKAVKEKIGTLRSEQLIGLDTEDLLEEPIAHNISLKELKSIEKKTGTKFSRNQVDEFYKTIREGNKEDGVLDYVNLAPNKNAKDKKTEKNERKGNESEIYLPSGNLSEEIRRARDSQNPPSAT